MKYLIYDERGGRFQTNYGWIKSASEIMEGEKMRSFHTRDEVDKLLKSAGYSCACSYGISKTHPLYKYC